MTNFKELLDVGHMTSYGPKLNFTNREMSYLKDRDVWEWSAVCYTNNEGSIVKSQDLKNGYQFLRDGLLDDYINFLKRSNY